MMMRWSAGNRIWNNDTLAPDVFISSSRAVCDWKARYLSVRWGDSGLVVHGGRVLVTPALITIEDSGFWEWKSVRWRNSKIPPNQHLIHTSHWAGQRCSLGLASGHTPHCTALHCSLLCHVRKMLMFEIVKETRKCLKYPDNNAYLGIIIITSCPVVSSAAASVTHPGRDTWHVTTASRSRARDSVTTISWLRLWQTWA